MSEEKQEHKPRRELVPVTMQGGMMQPQNLHEALELAKLIAYSGMVPKDYQQNPGAVLIAIQMGAEIGLSPMSSIQNIAVINGRPSVWGDAALAVVLAHPDCEGVDEVLDESTMTATCTVKRRNRAPVVRKFSVDDAKTANLWGKSGPWSNYPKRMLAMRARGFALRDSFPDALRGVHLAEESQDIVVNATPHFAGDEGGPKEGVHSFRGGSKPHALPSPGPAPVLEVAPSEETKPEPVAASAKAEEPRHEAAPLPAKANGGQQGLGW